jgi:hypothetical protein
MNNNIDQQSINDRIYSRNIPYIISVSEPSLPTRPVNTKYVYLQNIQPLYTTKLDYQQNKYDDNEIFNPGDRPGPWIGFSSHIDVESTLRDQLYKKNCQSNYYPNYQSSDLYNVNIPNNNNNNQNIKEFPYLFATIPKCSNTPQSIPSNNNINTFNTCTRLYR